MKILVFGFSLIFGILAFAYIPSTSFIFERTAGLHGKGAYKINTEVVFKDATGSQTVKETWLVVDGGEMFLQANGEGFHMSKLLKRGRLYWVDQDGAERANELTGDYFMTFLLTRSAQDLRRIFYRAGMIPVDATKDRRVPRDIKEIKHEPEEFVHLGRNNGAVQYAYNIVPDGPGVWIEQDHFFITRMRNTANALFNGQDYFIFARGLAFPRTQTITFTPTGAAETTVQIRVTNVFGVEFSADQKKQFEPSWFRSNQESAMTTWPKHPLAGIVQQFYKRFR